MYDSIYHFDPLNKLFLSFNPSFTLGEQSFDIKSSIRNHFFGRIFDPKNVINMFDNLETQAHFAHKMQSNVQWCANPLKYWIYDL